MLLLIILLAAVALALLCWGVYQLLASVLSDDAKRVAARLREAGAAHTPTVAAELLNRPVALEHGGAAMARFWLIQRWVAIEDRVARMVLRAGQQEPAWVVMLGGCVAAAAGAALVWLLGAAIWLEIPVALVLLASPYFLLLLLAEKRQALIEKQLPDLLDFISRSMSSGHDFSGALRLAASEAPQPIREEFQRAFDEMNYGGTVHDAMRDLVRRIECPSMMFFAVAVIINREVGGSLSTLLGDVASQVRERLTFRLKVRAMTGEGRASAIILGVMPFMIAGALVVLNRSYLTPLVTEPAGRKMLLAGLIWMGFGFAWMRRMVHVRL